jgi:ferrochelatase
MRYGSPSLDQALNALRDCQHIVIVPLFPQYASASSGSILQEALQTLASWQVIPSLSVVGPFVSDRRFINAWFERAAEYDLESYDDILFSFHGLPLSQIKKAAQSGGCLRPGCCDSLTEKNYYCYQAQCKTFAVEMAKSLALPKYTICYQSRLGIQRWLTPYTLDVIKERARQKKKRLLVFAPSFVADCLETLYEIGQEYTQEFLVHGGQTLDLVTSLNSADFWVDALSEIISDYLPCQNEFLEVERV